MYVTQKNIRELLNSKIQIFHLLFILERLDKREIHNFLDPLFKTKSSKSPPNISYFLFIRKRPINKKTNQLRQLLNIGFRSKIFYLLFVKERGIGEIADELYDPKKRRPTNRVSQALKYLKEQKLVSSGIHLCTPRKTYYHAKISKDFHGLLFNKSKSKGLRELKAIINSKTLKEIAQLPPSYLKEIKNIYFEEKLLIVLSYFIMEAVHLLTLDSNYTYPRFRQIYKFVIKTGGKYRSKIEQSKISYIKAIKEIDKFNEDSISKLMTMFYILPLPLLEYWKKCFYIDCEMIMDAIDDYIERPTNETNLRLIRFK